VTAAGWWAVGIAAWLVLSVPAALMVCRRFRSQDAAEPEPTVTEHLYGLGVLPRHVPPPVWPPQVTDQPPGPRTPPR